MGRFAVVAIRTALPRPIGIRARGTTRSPRILGRWVVVLVAVLLGLTAASSPARAQTGVPAPASSAPPQIDVSKLTAEERTELLSRLSDEQVRQLMMTYLREQAAPPAKQVRVIDAIDRDLVQFREGMGKRLSYLGELPAVPGFVYAKLSEGRGPYHPLVVFGLFVVIALVAFAVERVYRWGVRRLYEALTLPTDAEPLQRLGRLLAKLCLDLVGIAVFAAAVLAMFFLLYQGHGPTRFAVMTLLAVVLIVRVMSVFSRFFFAPYSSGLRVAPLDDEAAREIHRWIVASSAVTAFGLLACGLMLRLGLQPVLYDLLLHLVGVIVVLVLVIGALRVRKAVATALLRQIDGEGFACRLLRALATYWHVGFIAYVLFIFVLSTYKDVMGQEASSYPGLLSLLIVAALPGADFFLRSLLDRLIPADGTGGPRGKMSALPVFKRAARILLVIVALFLLGRVWGVNFFALGQESFGDELMRAVVDIALTLLVAYVAWGAIKAALARYLPAAAEEGAVGGGDEGGGASASRLETIMPLVVRFIQITLAVIVVMILLASLGVNIGPLLAGAGVVGLAVGFGAQTLVRDVVSGLFFLMDDAFRKGEYVDIGSVKGTVEGINIRSLVLRHHLGILHTVPYGEIQHLSNFSRDWVIVKMEFRVPTNTDINKVKKIFKQIGAEMHEHPDLGEDFLQPFKSQGVKAIEDSAIIVRGKFMSKPGRQFMLRKELYNRVQKAFQENGIEFAHRKVTVELPPDLDLTPEQEKQVAKAAGAAALAAEEAEKESQGHGG